MGLSVLQTAMSRRKFTGGLALAFLLALGLATVACSSRAKLGGRTAQSKLAMEKDPQRVAALLTAADAWVLPQPKEVRRTDGAFSLKRARGIRVVGKAEPAAAQELAGLLKERAGVELKTVDSGSHRRQILLGVFPDGKVVGMPGIQDGELKDLGQQGYVLHVDARVACVAATDPEGLRYGARTLSQLAADRTELPGLHLRDWPAMAWRGVMQDICRGQVPTVDTLKRLTRVCAEGKLNILELYIEHTFKFQSHPDTSPPEGLAPAEARELFAYAKERGVDLHPLFQVLGHAGTILSNPKYKHLAVRDREHIWEMTYDIRKPESVDFVLGMVKELHDAMPGKFFCVDITENDAEGFNKSGTSDAELAKLMYDYMLKLRETLNPAVTRLMPTQYSIGSEGAQGGLGAHMAEMPKDIVLGTYYTTLPHINCWEADYPRLQKAGRDFFSNPWIYSHNRLMPWMEGAAKFSDDQISKGLAYGAIGSITCDWGDEGHYHLVGQEWYPILYHGASAWTGAKVDQAYFDKAFCRLFYGTKDDAVARALRLATSVYGLNVAYRNAEGKEIEGDPQEVFLGGFFQTPWGAPCDRLVNPLATGEAILKPALEAVKLMEGAKAQATRNQDNLEQLLFGVRHYEAMGRKFIMRAHDLDKQYPREQVKAEVAGLLQTYTGLKADFERLWLAEDRDNKTFRDLLSWYNNTLVPCQQRLQELEQGK